LLTKRVTSAGSKACTLTSRIAGADGVAGSFANDMVDRAQGRQRTVDRQATIEGFIAALLR
jgi:hypothetical protein